MSTSLAQERRIRQRQRESFSQSITEVQQPRLYNDDSEEEEVEEELELVRGNRDDEAIEVPAKKDEEAMRRELEEQYAQKKKARRPNNRPTLEKLAKAVQGPGGFVAIPSLCQKEIAKAPKIRNKQDTKSARRYLNSVFHAYQEGAEQWVQGWNWLEACLMTEQLKGKEIKSFLQHQRDAERLNYMSKKLGMERAEVLVGQLIEEAKEMSHDSEGLAYVNDSIPDTTGEEERELELPASIANTDANGSDPGNKNSSPSGEPRAVGGTNHSVMSRTPRALEEDDEDGPAASLPRPVSEEPTNKKRRVIFDDEDDEEEMEFGAKGSTVGQEGDSFELQQNSEESNEAFPNDSLEQKTESLQEDNSDLVFDSDKETSMIAETFQDSQNIFVEQAEQDTQISEHLASAEDDTGNGSASDDEIATLMPTQATQIDLASQESGDDDDVSEAETIMATQAMDMIATQPALTQQEDNGE